MKKRTESKRIGNKGINKLREYCENNGLIFQAEPREDYGIDCYIEIEIEKEPKNFIIGAQVKCGNSYKKQINKDGTFSIYIKKDDLLYWLAANYPLFFIYYDNIEDKIYFKHIQLEISKHQNIDEISKFIFSESDLANNKKLVNYAIDLISKTPNILNRLKILNSKEIILSTNSTKFILKNRLSEYSRNINFNGYTPDKFYEPDDKFLAYSIILGYDLYDKWICELEIIDHDPRDGCDANVYFRNLKENNFIKFDLFDLEKWEEDIENGKESKLIQKYSNDINCINKLMSILKIKPAISIYNVYENLYDNKNNAITISFEDEIFKFEISSLRNRDEILLTNEKYIPQRKASILIREINQAYMLVDNWENLSENNFYSFLVPHRIEQISEIFVSPTGNLVSIALITNANNPCSGNRLVHLMHIYVEELREICVRSLNS